MSTPCRGCGAGPLSEIFDLGLVPSVNAFRTREELAGERAHRLGMYWCRSCTLVQLGEIVPPAELFTSYQHLSSASQSNVRHLEEVAHLLGERYALGPSSRVLEVGSNDGSLLAHIRRRAGTVLGVDPARNLATLARERGVETISDFFGEAVASQIVREHGRFDVIVALNVVAHTPDVQGLLGAIARVLAPGGTFVMEAVHVFPTILHGEFDTVYHEHVYCFSLTALELLLGRAGLMVVDVEQIPTQGASLRVHARHAGEGVAPSAAVARLRAEEEAEGVRDEATYARVGVRVQAFKQTLRERLGDLRARHGRVYGLGAPARGVVVLNYCQIGPDLVPVVIDDTPLKQGRLVPGVHIPVAGWDVLAADPPTAYLLLSWNYEQEIARKLARWVRTAELLVPFPEITLRPLGAGAADGQ